MKQFETPDFEVIKVIMPDVITTSGDGNWVGDDDDENGTGWH